MPNFNPKSNFSPESQIIGGTMYVQSPYSGDSPLSQFPKGVPPILGLNIDRCITFITMLQFLPPCNWGSYFPLSLFLLPVNLPAPFLPDFPPPRPPTPTPSQGPNSEGSSQHQTQKLDLEMKRYIFIYSMK